MNWEELIAFIDERDAGFAERVQGSSFETIAALQSYCPRALPAHYVGYLRALGENSGGFKAFPKYLCKGSELLEELRSQPRLRYDAQRYFKVAIFLGEDPTEGGHFFLDLARADEGDAPLVLATEAGMEDIDIDWGDRHRCDAFELYEFGRRRLGVAMIVSGTEYREDEEIDRSAERWGAACDVLRRAGFKEVLSGSRFVWCGLNDDVSVMGVRYRSGGAFGIRINGDERRRVARMAEVLRDQLDVIDIREDEFH